MDYEKLYLALKSVVSDSLNTIGKVSSDLTEEIDRLDAGAVRRSIKDLDEIRKELVGALS